MSDKTTIEWADATWNPITGCSLVSPGCTNCYAMRLSGTRMKNHWSRKGLTKPGPAGPVWNGQVRFNTKWIGLPLRWRKPRRIFVCAHADLFHEDVPDKWIDKVFAVMALAPQHTYQVLTKRAGRMKEYMKWNAYQWGTPNTNEAVEWRGAMVERMAQKIYHDRTGEAPSMRPAVHLPLPNVWLGVSVEDQKRADERIPVLLDTPAAVRFISAEPLLGPVELYHPIVRHLVERDSGGDIPRIDWVIAGGESGPGARPMHPNWARSIRNQCISGGVPFHFKQWGEWWPYTGGHKQDHIFEDGQAMLRVGKKEAGRGLDGRTWNQFPQEISTQ